MIPRRIHQCWLGGEIPANIKSWIKTVGEFHPDWTRIIWTDLMLQEIGINAPEMKERLGNWASVTNEIRLRLLYRFGGVWLDADIQAIDTLDCLPLDSYVAFAGVQDGGRLCNAVMGSEVHSPWIAWQLMALTGSTTYHPQDAAAGVYVCTDSPRDNLTILPQPYFYPWLWGTPAADRNVSEDTILIHHWEGSWVQK